MILVVGSATEPMVSHVYDELERRGSTAFLIDVRDMPSTVGFSLSPPGQDPGDRLCLEDGTTINLRKVTAIYQRIGFGNFEAFEGYSEAEVNFVSQECQSAWLPILNSWPSLVVNRPVHSGSNASKPFQIGLFEEYGFRVPLTLVTNNPKAARAFYDEHEGRVIYKSISYTRSIVQGMDSHDLERLDTLVNCPVQLQERIEGNDMRVHVVGDRVFASRIVAESSDYRYDKEARVEAWQLPSEIEEQCVALARGLGLALTGIDLRHTPDGDYVCFEANPSPAFSWYEARTEQPITAALCDLLEEA